MNRMLKWTALALAVTLPLSAQAHRAWMLPSSTVLSGEEPWITVDAAVSNDLFYFEHFPLQLEGIGKPLQMPARTPQAAQGDKPATPAPAPMRRPANKLVILAPDGSEVDAQNGAVGRYRSTFDVHLTQKGTYKLAVASSGLMATWKEGEERRRWMGKAEELKQAIPANASELQVIQRNSRMETFVTAGNPTDKVLAPTNQGLELVPVTHPNDLFAGEAAEFTFLLDGKPAKDVEISVVPGGNRYRDETGDFTVKTDAEGKVAITWPTPGMYWLEAELSTTEGVAKPVTERRAVYSATLEVQAP
ncbi:DUF4198 domain-containing protein [Stutzerimonas sp. NM35]|uniref:DUF4198 domain-containing protein n=1 Tax=Stutzerimonas stutzeri TaxID=316 RepID=UPI0015E41B3A|nr:DUF4198 domain-containing protein [Stutzerimonas stutzeri]MBA1264014.1 DUF4198 domain-containing protein [Stutzerimonas stutzeri]